MWFRGQSAVCEAEGTWITQITAGFVVVNEYCFVFLWAPKTRLTSDVFKQDKSGDKNVPLFPRPPQRSLWTGRAWASPTFSAWWLSAASAGEFSADSYLGPQAAAKLKKINCVCHLMFSKLQVMKSWSVFKLWREKNRCSTSDFYPNCQKCQTRF